MPRHGYHSRASDSTLALTRFLGWFSVGLGMAELLAPRQVGRPVGLEDRDGLLRGYGLREIATGIGILASENPAPWMWGRVAGDALDVATVAAASDPHKRNRLTPAVAALGLIGLLDLYCAARLTAEATTHAGRVPDHSGRSGFPDEPERMRGAARDLPAGEFVP